MKKILLVDDDESIQLLYREELKDEGYNVVSAFNGEEALELFSREKPDLVVLDIQMPDMNGIEVLRQMKMMDEKIPVVLSSAYHEYKQDLGAWASEDYVVKSADSSDLLAAIEKLLG